MVLRLSLLTLLIAGINFEVSSQIIKVDKDWVTNDSTKSWQGLIEVATDNIRNTQSIFQLASALQVSYSRDKHFILSSSNLRLLFADKEPLENAGFQHFRYMKTIDSVFAMEVFTQVQFDQLLKIKMRWITGMGPRFTLVNNKKAQLFFRPGYMFEYEEEDSTGIINRHHRMSNYATLRVKAGEKVRFYFTVFFQPRLSKFTDYRLSPAWTLEMNILKRLIVSITGDLRYDSQPVAGVDKFTYVLSQGLGWRF